MGANLAINGYSFTNEAAISAGAGLSLSIDSTTSFTNEAAISGDNGSQSFCPQRHLSSSTKLRSVPVPGQILSSTACSSTKPRSVLVPAPTSSFTTSKVPSPMRLVPRSAEAPSKKFLLSPSTRSLLMMA